MTEAILIFSRRIFFIIGNKYKLGLYIILLLTVIMAFSDVLAVVLIMPFIGLAMNSEMIQRNRLLRFLYEEIGFESREDFQLYFGIFVAIVILLTISFKTFAEYKIFKFKSNLERDILKKIYGQVLHQDYECFFEWRVSDLNKFLNNEVSQFINAVISPLMEFFAKSAISVALISLLIYVNLKLALGSMAVLMSFYVIAFLYTKKKLHDIDLQKKKLAKYKNRMISDSLNGIRDVKISRIEGYFTSKLETVSNEIAKIQLLSQMIKVVPRNIIELFAFSGLIGFVVYLVMNGSGLGQSVPMIALYVMACYKLIPAMQGAYSSFSKLRVGMIVLDDFYFKLKKISDYRLEINRNPDCKNVFRLEHCIELQGVDYKYNKSKKKLFENFNLKIAAKKTIGIIGSSGAGKTTLVDIVAGLLKVQGGYVLLDGKRLSEENLDGWADQIGYVPQDINLINGSVAENISFGCKEDSIDFDRVEASAKLANIHDFVLNNLPKGYESLIGEVGFRLSGGLKQRIGIARALYRQPSVLIFDEATSALDNKTEKEIVDAISSLSHKMTIIVIAHRLSTLKECDMIMVLKNGKIVDSGKYSELELRNEFFVR